MASSTSAWSLKEVSTTTCTAGSWATMWRVASTPPIRGIDRSISTTWGLSFLASATASRPSEAVPTTSTSSTTSSSDWSPASSSRWSSTSSTRII
jgi:hypothetical protein